MKLELKSIALSLGGKPILKDVSFAVEDGQFVSILGESGAGKSTTLKVISGLLPQDSGQVFFEGTCVDDVAPHKRGVSTVFQDIRLFPNMNVEDNVAFALKMRRVPKAKRLEEAHRLLAAVKLADFGERKITELSGGQQQRVALARSLAARPGALLLDEPFSGLDEQLRDEMRHLVMDLHERFTMTSLMVTHDPDEALMMSDKILFMSDGRLIQTGTPAEMLLSPCDESVRTCFSDSAALSGVVASEEFTCGKLVLPAPGVADGDAVLVRVPGHDYFIHPLGESA